MTEETRHALVTALGGAIATVGMFVFYLVSEPWGWVLAAVGMALFAAPFVILWRDIWRTLRRMKRRS